MKPVSGQEAELSAKVKILNSQLQGWSGHVDIGTNNHKD
jgi:hypothetical protein